MPVRFARALRLHSRAEFTAVQEHGRRAGGRFVTVLARPNTLGHDRLGLIASRRLGGAVVRNRAKRRLRELFRRQWAEAPPPESRRGWDVVVIGRTGIADAPFEALAADVSAAMRRARGARVPAA